MEMRRMVGVLRTEPLPLSRLAEDARAAGVEVDLVLTGELPDALAGSVFRIVQESLTNAVRHAAPARCRVEVFAGDDEVTIEITDDGRGPGVGSNGGHGLIGMCERVVGHRGDFRAGPGGDGGFRVRARLPIPPPGRGEPKASRTITGLGPKR
jgi:signal transduction histidine kinase